MTINSSASRRRALPAVAALLLAAFCMLSVEAALADASTFLSIDSYLTQICRAMGLESQLDQCLSFLVRHRIVSVNTAPGVQQGTDSVNTAQGVKQLPASANAGQGVQQGTNSVNTAQGLKQLPASANAVQGLPAPIISVTAAAQEVRLHDPVTRDFALEVSSRITSPAAPSFLSQNYVADTFLADHASALELTRSHNNDQDFSGLFDADAHEHQHHCPTPRHHHAPHQNPCPHQP